MKTQTYTTNTQTNGNDTKYFVNFEDGTMAVVNTVEFQTLKGIRTKCLSVTGNYNRDIVSVSMGSNVVGGVDVMFLNGEKGNEGEVVNHKVWGECTIIDKGDMMKVQLPDGTIKMVVEKFFMNAII